MNKEAIGTLTGKYFHSVKSDRETIEWQGKFLGLASPGLYRVQTYEWMNDTEHEQMLVPATDMRYWRIYDTAEAMQAAYRDYCSRRKTGYRASPDILASADLVIQHGQITKWRGKIFEQPQVVVVDGVVAFNPGGAK